MSNKFFFQQLKGSLLFFSFFLCIFAGSFTSSAQTTYFFNSTGFQDSWTDATKWSPTYPGNTIDVADAVVINGTLGSSCLINADITINGHLEVLKNIYINTNITITTGANSEIIVAPSTTIQLDYNAQCTINLYGNLNLTLSSLVAYGTNTFNNYGTVNNTGTFQPSICNNYGTINNGGIASGTFINQNTNSQISNNGELNGNLDINQGSFQNNRIVSCTSILGNLTNNTHSKVAPNSFGSTIGTMNISGNYTSADTLEIEIISSSNASDKLVVGGNAAIAGKLVVKGSFFRTLPSVGSTYTIINAASISGTFDPSNIILPAICNFDVIYDVANGDVKLIVTSLNVVNYTFTATTSTDNWSDPTKWTPSVPDLNTINEYDSILIKQASMTSGICHINQTLSIKSSIKVYGSTTIDNMDKVTINSPNKLIVAPSGLLTIEGELSGGVVDSGIVTIASLGNVVGGITVYSGATLTNSGNLTCKANIGFGVHDNSGIINNYGNIFMDDYIDSWSNFGTINNYKKIAISNTNTWRNRSTGIVNSYDTILLKGTSTILNEGLFNTSGLIKFDQNSRSITNSSGATFNLSGRLENFNTSSGVYSFCSNQGSIIYGAVSLKGNIGISGNFTNQVGNVVSPGNSPGIISISGNYVNNGTLEIELKNVPASLGDNPFANNDLLIVTGTAILGGTLNVSLINGFVPQGGNQWRIVNAASLSGTFTTINLPSAYIWNINYDNNAGDVILSVSQVLPIELVAFEAKKENKAILLSWQSKQEANISHFDIERSVDGFVFEPIGTLKAEKKPSKYQFTDSNPVGNFMYYRLRIHDIDEQSELSKIISIQFRPSNSIKITPSVFSDILNIKSENEDFTVIKIVNTIGQTVFSATLKSALTIMTGSWQNGLYFVQFKTNKNDTISEKIIKL